jgi:CheY-like chemotaxis protein
MSQRNLVILIDDDPMIIRIVESMLKSLNIPLMTTTNPTGGLGLIKENEARVGIVLLDIAMPGINGLELCRSIRALPDLGGLPVVAVTADIGPDTADEVAAAGFNEVITKPFTRDNLLTVLGNYGIS